MHNLINKVLPWGDFIFLVIISIRCVIEMDRVVKSLKLSYACYLSYRSISILVKQGALRISSTILNQ